MSDVISELQKININVHSDNVMLWTDSTIVLSWINCNQPLKTYIANRVDQILEVTTAKQWKLVPTDDNPSDLITKGITADTLIDQSLWWHGPRWLTETPDNWPQTKVHINELPEIRSTKLVLSATQQTDNDLLK